MIAAFPPRRSSFEIRSLIRKSFTLAAVDLRNSLLPEVVTDSAMGRSTSGLASGADLGVWRTRYLASGLT